MAWSLVAGAQAGPVSPADQAELERQATEALRLQAATVVDLEVVAGPRNVISATIPIEGLEYTVDFEPFSVRAPGFHVWTIGADGVLQPTDAGEARTYRGAVRGTAGAEAAGIIQDGRFRGMVWIGSDRWGVQPLAGVVPAAGPAAHAVYRSTDVIWPQGATCGSGHDLHDDHESLPVEQAESLGGDAGLRVPLLAAEIAIDADYELYVDLGSSSPNVIAHVESIMAGVAVQYERDTDITYQITDIVIRSSSGDPYSNASSACTNLTEMRDEWTTNPSLMSIPRDIAHLFSGSAYGTVIGCTYVAQICNNLAGYGASGTTSVSPYAAQVDLVAHELGHSWSAGHCDEVGDNNYYAGCCASGYTMCSYLAAPHGNIFDPATISVITGYAAGRPCLSSAADPIAIPVSDNFDGSTTFDSTKWITVSGAEINGGGVSEPSAPYSADLDNQDEVRSNQLIINGAGYDGATLAWASERRGTEAGDDLVLEYRNTSAVWVEFARKSGGATQNTYESNSVQLPEGALYDGVQLRFRAAGDDGTDDWYVDDVSITGCLGAVISQHPLAIGVCLGGTAQFSVAATGAGTLIYRWYKDGVALFDGGNISGVTGTTLTISNVSGGDGGNYRCKINDDCGVVWSNQAALSPLTAASITGHPATLLNKCEGSTASFSVTAGGSAPFTYQWYENGQLIPNANGATLNLTNITMGQDGAAYTCFVSNACGSAWSNAGVLNVVYINFTDQPDDACGEVGSTVSTSTDALSGGGAIIWQWWKGASQVSGQSTRFLTLNNVQPANEGAYRARAIITSPTFCEEYSEEANVLVGNCCTTPGDMDGDGDFDLADMSAFTLCFGSGAGLVPGCECANVALDLARDVDLLDWSALESLLGGPQ